tara:strand:+ start:361 stop:540 length:180 start_codon:yes stop_codon:yes gene_type:complete
MIERGSVVAVLFFYDYYIVGLSPTFRVRAVVGCGGCFGVVAFVAVVGSVGIIVTLFGVE